METEDAHSGTITGADVVYRDIEDVLDHVGGVNPVTGPVHVRGVEPGDCIEVEILHVEGAPVRGFGHMNTTPTLLDEFEAATTICHRVGDDKVEIPTARGPVLVPYHPFVGTIGVAPAGEPVMSFSQRDDILGNVDLPDVCDGATIVMKANVPGALLYLGDAHLAQGDAEIHRSAIETQADVTLRVRRRTTDETVYRNLPQVNTAHTLGSVAPGPGHLEDLVRAAYDDLALRIRDGYGYSLQDAYRLLGAAGRVRIGQVVPPVYSAMAMIDRALLNGEEL